MNSNSYVRAAGRYIMIHTDGGCTPNPGKGHWAAVLRRMDGPTEIKNRQLKGAEVASTNSRMELTAAIEAIRFLRADEKEPIVLVSDSQYLINNVNSNLAQWKAPRMAKGRQECRP